MEGNRCLCNCEWETARGPGSLGDPGRGIPMLLDPPAPLWEEAFSNCGLGVG